MIWIMIIMIVALALIGVPMSFSMLTGSVWFMLTSGMPQTLMIQRLIMAVGDSFSMLAIPFFMLAGTIMNAGGVAARIFDFCNTLVGHIPGGLGHVNVFCSVIFAGMSGSALADTGGIGAIELKAMKDQGFDEDFSAAITGASSCLGPIIPPSTGMVLYAMMAEESVGTLFIAGVLPGIIMAAAMCPDRVYHGEAPQLPHQPARDVEGARPRILARRSGAAFPNHPAERHSAGHLLGDGSFGRLLSVFAVPGHLHLQGAFAQGAVQRVP